jgi:predicted lipoprotein with Yx(FWY)xxD motif
MRAVHTDVDRRRSIAAAKGGAVAIRLPQCDMETAMTHAQKTGLAGLGLATALAMLCAAPASAEDYGPLKVTATAMGKVLSDANGMTLYTYDKDAAGKSNCNDQCAEYWPPVKATADDKPVGDLTIIKRDDGSMQWADGGKPLYTFVKDKKPGDMVGDKMKDVWHAVME